MIQTQNTNTNTNSIKLYNDIYKGKKVFLTGHTGFKGSWLSLWLQMLGAEVKGYSLESETNPNHFSLLNLEMESVFADIRDYDRLSKELNNFKPDIVIHMAAQPLVRLSYSEPRLTYETNVMGTVNVLESVRRCDCVKAVVNITTDKCYENKEWVWGYRENDPMGGYDPYSSSKGCAELVASAFRNSYFNNEDYGKKHETLIASVRAGNVIGGGDWAADRLVPDIMRSTSKGELVEIRSPKATRPWEHVLEPLSGYLMIGQKLLEGKKEFAEGWNFGPGDEGVVRVVEVIDKMKKHWDKINYKVKEQNADLHEANLLKLDCSKVHMKLKWKSNWSMDKTFEKTVDWYKKFYESSKIITEKQIEEYINCAVNKKLFWSI